MEGRTGTWKNILNFQFVPWESKGGPKERCWKKPILSRIFGLSQCSGIRTWCVVRVKRISELTDACWWEKCMLIRLVVIIMLIRLARILVLNALVFLPRCKMMLWCIARTDIIKCNCINKLLVYKKIFQGFKDQVYLSLKWKPEIFKKSVEIRDKKPVCRLYK